MANLTAINLKITNTTTNKGGLKKLEVFVNENKKELFAATVPVPTEINTDFWTWAQNNWGATKEIVDLVMDVTDEEINMFFYGSNGSCIPFVRALSKQFSDLFFNVAYCDEAESYASGLFDICESQNINTSDNHPDILDDEDVRLEVLERCWNSDIFCQEDNVGEVYYRVNNDIVRGEYLDDGYFRIYHHYFCNNKLYAGEKVTVESDDYEDTDEFLFTEAFNDCLDFIDFIDSHENTKERFLARLVTHLDGHEYYELLEIHGL